MKHYWFVIDGIFTLNIHCLFHMPLAMRGWYISTRGRHGCVTCFDHWNMTGTDSLTSEQRSFVAHNHQLFFLLTWNYYVLDKGCFFILGFRMRKACNRLKPHPSIDMRINFCCEPLRSWILCFHIAQTDGKITDCIFFTFFWY